MDEDEAARQKAERKKRRKEEKRKRKEERRRNKEERRLRRAAEAAAIDDAPLPNVARQSDIPTGSSEASLSIIPPAAPATNGKKRKKGQPRPEDVTSAAAENVVQQAAPSAKRKRPKASRRSEANGHDEHLAEALPVAFVSGNAPPDDELRAAEKTRRKKERRKKRKAEKRASKLLATTAPEVAAPEPPANPDVAPHERFAPHSLYENVSGPSNQAVVTDSVQQAEEQSEAEESSDVDSLFDPDARQHSPSPAHDADEAESGTTPKGLETSNTMSKESQASQAKRKARKISRLDAIISEAGRGVAMSGHSYAAMRGGKRRSLKTADDVIADAAGLSHEDMLADRAYTGPHLKILKDHYELDYKVGAFSRWEQERMVETLEAFMEEKELDLDEVAHIIHDRGEVHEHELYDVMCKKVTRSVPGRPLKFVREWIRRKHPKRQYAQGAWTEEQLAQLRIAFRTHSRSWPQVAAATGRKAEACRTKIREWRDFGEAGEDDKKFKKWSREEVASLRAAVEEAQREKDDASSPDKVDLWALVSTIHASHQYSRARNSCLIKWRDMQAASVSVSWDIDKDSKELIKRLSKQKRALDRSDFSEVDFDKLCDKDWKWDRRIMHRHWRQALKLNISKDAARDPYRNFAKNVGELMAIIRRGIFVPTHFKAKAAIPARDDMIESDEERDELRSDREA